MKMDDHQHLGESLKWAWLVIGLVAALDFIWARRIDFRIYGIGQATLLTGILLAIGLFYGHTGRNHASV